MSGPGTDGDQPVSGADAYGRIRRRIVEGSLRPGERLVEQRLAADLSLSRTPVREALRMLQSEGLVEFEPNRGARVRALGRDEVRDLYDLRSRLEGMAAELAASRATPGERRAMAAVHAEFTRAVAGAAGGDLEAVRAVYDANGRFHGAIIAAAHHQRLADMLVRTVDQTLVFQAFRHYDPADLERSVVFHGLILDAVAAGDGARASRLACEHVLQGCDRLFAVIGDRDSLDPLYDAADGARHA